MPGRDKRSRCIEESNLLSKTRRTFGVAEGLVWRVGKQNDYPSWDGNVNMAFVPIEPKRNNIYIPQ